MGKESNGSYGLVHRVVSGLALSGIIVVITIGMRSGGISQPVIFFLSLVCCALLTGTGPGKKYVAVYRMMAGLAVFLMFVVVLGCLQAGVSMQVMAFRAFITMIGVLSLSRVILSVLATFEEI